MSTPSLNGLTDVKVAADGSSARATAPALSAALWSVGDGDDTDHSQPGTPRANSPSAPDSDTDWLTAPVSTDIGPSLPTSTTTTQPELAALLSSTATSNSTLPSNPNTANTANSTNAAAVSAAASLQATVAATLMSPPPPPLSPPTQTATSTVSHAIQTTTTSSTSNRKSRKESGLLVSSVLVNSASNAKDRKKQSEDDKRQRDQFQALLNIHLKQQTGEELKKLFEHLQNFASNPNRYQPPVVFPQLKREYNHGVPHKYLLSESPNPNLNTNFIARTMQLLIRRAEELISIEDAILD